MPTAAHHPDRPSAASFATIFSRDGIAGSGFLIDGARVVTCAHVVNAVLGRALADVERPNEATVDVGVTIDRRPLRLTAALRAWSPPFDPDAHPSEGGDGLDLAILAFVEPPPLGLATARLGGAPKMSETLVGFGHPRAATGGGYEMGVAMKLDAVAALARPGLWQFQSDASGIVIAPGASGGPVIDARGVVRAMIQSATSRADRTGFGLAAPEIARFAGFPASNANTSATMEWPPVDPVAFLATLTSGLVRNLLEDPRFVKDIAENLRSAVSGEEVVNTANTLLARLDDRLGVKVRISKALLYSIDAVGPLSYWYQVFQVARSAGGIAYAALLFALPPQIIVGWKDEITRLLQLIQET